MTMAVTAKFHVITKAVIPQIVDGGNGVRWVEQLMQYKWDNARGPAGTMNIAIS